MSKEVKRYPDLDFGNIFIAHIPLVEGFEKAVGQVESDENFKSRIESYATEISEKLGLKVEQLIFNERGLSHFSVVPGQCACIGIAAKSWEERNRALPEFSTHNVDNAIQYTALTSVVFYYLNRLQRLVSEKLFYPVEFIYSLNIKFLTSKFPKARQY
ncbi:MAG TPA: hypothetical protein VIK81_04710 [Patescibacteria group bacterium]